LIDRLDLDFGDNEIDHGTSDDYYTPPFIFKALDIKFDMDVCAPPGGVPWIPANQSLSVIDDGLVMPWAGRVWCNPPFSNASPWIKKLIDHNNGIALLTASKAVWFHEAWEKATGILPLSSNFKFFLLPTGESKSVFMPVMLFAFGEDNLNVLKLSELGRVR